MATNILSQHEKCLIEKMCKQVVKYEVVFYLTYKHVNLRHLTFISSLMFA